MECAFNPPAAVPGERRCEFGKQSNCVSAALEVGRFEGGTTEVTNFAQRSIELSALSGRFAHLTSAYLMESLRVRENRGNDHKRGCGGRAHGERCCVQPTRMYREQGRERASCTSSCNERRRSWNCSEEPTSPTLKLPSRHFGDPTLRQAPTRP